MIKLGQSMSTAKARTSRSGLPHQVCPLGSPLSPPSIPRPRPPPLFGLLRPEIPTSVRHFEHNSSDGASKSCGGATSVLRLCTLATKPGPAGAIRTHGSLLQPSHKKPENGGIREEEDKREGEGGALEYRGVPQRRTGVFILRLFATATGRSTQLVAHHTCFSPC